MLWEWFQDEAAPPPPDRFRLPGRQTGKTDSFSAASAISGQTRANAELPYMTPPLLRASEERDRHDGCSHFSGDSQDSFNSQSNFHIRHMPFLLYIKRKKMVF